MAGVFNADPRILPTARKLSRVSFDKMLELAASGAKVLQLRSVEFARNHGPTARPLDVLRHGRDLGHRGGRADAGEGDHATDGLAKVSVVGAGTKSHPGVDAATHETFGLDRTSEERAA